jgi:outer membrane receptor for ferrienterochelin and colicins
MKAFYSKYLLLPKIFSVRFLSTLLILFSSFYAYSQEKQDSVTFEKKHKQVSISATKSSKSLDALPIPGSIIDKKEIAETAATKLDEVIEKQTGIVSVPTKTGTKGVQMQGLDASYTAILLDGCPMIGRSFGALDLNRISLADIEKIEIIRGASSSLYGSNALGGVINLISKTQVEDGKNIFLSMKYGTNNSLNSSALYQYKKGRLQLSNSIDYYKTDGFDLIDSDLLSTINPFRNYSFRSKIKYDLSEKIILKANGRYFNQEQENTGEKSNFLLEGQSEIKEWNLGSSIKYLMHSNFSTEVEIYTTNYRTDEFLQNQNGSLFDENYFDHTLLQSELRNNFNFKAINGIIGFGMTKEKLDRKDFSSIAQQDLKFLYGQLDCLAFGVVDIIAGSRYDNYNNYSPEISNKLALGFPISKQLKINGSVGTGFKIPDFRQRYFDFTNSTIGYTVLGREVAFNRLTAMENDGMLQGIFIPFSEINSPLKSETSLNINVGIRFKVNEKTSFNINFFKNEVVNLIEAQLVANKSNSLPVFSYFNLNQVETKGVEFNTRFRPNNKLEIKGGYQLLYANDIDVKNRFEDEDIYARDLETLEILKLSKGDYFGLFNRSRHMGNLKLYYDLNEKININTIITYRSKYALNDSNGNNILDAYDEFIEGYTLCDLGITHYTTSLRSIQLGVKNIFNFTNPEYISNISGRLYYINLKITINN